MKNPCLSLVIAVALASCASPQPDVVRQSGNVTYPPTSNVDVLDVPPARAYQEIGIIDVPGEPGTVRAQVVAQIRVKAQQIGADAVILQDVSRTAPVAPRLNPTTGTYETTGGQVIPAFKGVAIKYK